MMSLHPDHPWIPPRPGPYCIGCDDWLDLTEKDTRENTVMDFGRVRSLNLTQQHHFPGGEYKTDYVGLEDRYDDMNLAEILEGAWPAMDVIHLDCSESVVNWTYEVGSVGTEVSLKFWPLMPDIGGWCFK